MFPPPHRAPRLPGDILFLLLLCSSCGDAGDNSRINHNGKIYHNQFAVHIPGGASVASSIASKHGLHNLGQIGDLENYFLFEGRRIQKRSLSASHEHKTLLEEEDHVTWVEQQHEKIRVKRVSAPPPRSFTPTIISNTPNFDSGFHLNTQSVNQDTDHPPSGWEPAVKRTSGGVNSSTSEQPRTRDARRKREVEQPRTRDARRKREVEQPRTRDARRKREVEQPRTPDARRKREVEQPRTRDARRKREEREVVMRDPMFRDQWFLNHGARDGSDMNVKPAWEMGITGKKVVVTILDDGIQYDHPDLKQNYDPLASKDINDNDDDPMPQDNGDNKHGTRCAGEVAATAFNDYCGVGIAYNASIGGVRMLDGMVNDAVEARSLSLNPNHIDIYSASWGPEDDGKTVDGPGPLAKKAFINGITSGRGGKGSIFVWASGNGGHHTDNCNCDGYTNSIFTLSISSATQGGFKPWYLEQCSSTLATTYSSGTPGQDASITTVDQDKALRSGRICTSSHTGTSASAPLAAGVCALALEANPSLTWRDMQHIVVLTSNPEPLKHETDWDKNALGRKFSHKFGFGLMDAFELVKLAQKWKQVGPQHICETRVETVDKLLPRYTTMKVNVTLITDGCDNMLSKVRFLEHVQCRISLKYSPRGQLKIALRSPRGTKSYLLFGRPKDKFASSFEDWPFLSVHFWGEDPTGQWTLEITNTGSKDASSDGILKHWQLVLHGTENSPINHGNPPSSNSSIPVKSGGHKANRSITYLPITSSQNPSRLDIDTSVPRVPLTVIGCHEDCEGGCFGPSASQCNGCKRFRYQGNCVNSCPASTYPSIPRLKANSAVASWECRPCHPSCGTCFGPGYTSCSSCLKDTYLLSDQSTCLAKCPSGYLVNHATHTCSPCPSPCSACQSGYNHTDCEWCKFHNAQCTQCPSDLILYHGECVAACPAAHFVSSENQTKRCVPCHSNCSSCVGPRDTQCGLCQEGTFYFERRCVPYCPARYTASLDLRECLACSRGCDSCPGEAGKCKVCQSGWELTTEGACQPEASKDCQPGMYTSNSIGSCLACHKSCRTCSGPRHTDCSACYPDHRLHVSSCVETCPPGSYPAPTTHTCLSCPHSCATCDNQSCNSCKSGYHLLNGRCVVSCGSGMFSDPDSVCRRCDDSCRECKGPGTDQCITCDPSKGLILVDGRCLSNCPAGLYLPPSLPKAVPPTCSRCHASCSSCSNAIKCLTCPTTNMPVDAHCVSCEDSYFFSATLQRCVPCHSSCSSCSGPGSTECLSCHTHLQLDTWSNSCVPCCATYQDHVPCCLCGSSGVCASSARTMRSKPSSTSITGLVLTVAGAGAAVAALVFVINTVRAGRKERIKRGKVYSKVPGRNKDEILLINQTSEDQSDNESSEEDEESEFLVVEG